MRYVQVAPATIVASPASGAPGSQVTLSGAGFAGNEPLSVLFVSGTTVFTETHVQPVASSISGTFTYPLTVPSLAGSGTATIEVIDPSRTVAVTGFTVQGTGLTATPTATAATATETPTAVGGSTATLALPAGWNLIALPLSPTVPLQAQTVLGSVVGPGGAGLGELATWNGSAWTTALDSGGVHSGSDFPLLLGQGYFLYTDQAVSVTVSGSTPVLTPTQTLVAGWNLVGAPLAGSGQTASSLLSSLAAAGLQPSEVAAWTGTSWQTLVQPAQGPPVGSDFALNAQEGYFVYVQNSGPWPTG